MAQKTDEMKVQFLPPSLEEATIRGCGLIAERIGFRLKALVKRRTLWNGDAATAR